jgi:hypothetical protein
MLWALDAKYGDLLGAVIGAEVGLRIRIPNSGCLNEECEANERLGTSADGIRGTIVQERDELPYGLTGVLRMRDPPCITLPKT